MQVRRFPSADPSRAGQRLEQPPSGRDVGGDAYATPLLALAKKLLGGILACGRGVRVAVDPAGADDSLQLTGRLAGLEQADEVHSVLGHRLEPGEHRDAGGASSLP